MNDQKYFSGSLEIATNKNKPIGLKKEYPDIKGTFFAKYQSTIILPNQPRKERTRNLLGKKLLILSIPW